MRRTLLTCLMLCGAVGAQGYNDSSTTVKSTEAGYQLLQLGKGALAVLTFPGNVASVTTTRSDIAEIATDENRVILAGLSNYGETPLLVKMEDGTIHTWRISLAQQFAGRILNVNVEAAPAEPISAPQEAATTAQKKEAAFRWNRVGPPEQTSLLFSVTAGDEAVVINESQLLAAATGKRLQVKPGTAPLHQIPAGKSAYGVVTVSGANGPVTVNWPYQEGGASKQHQFVLP